MRKQWHQGGARRNQGLRDIKHGWISQLVEGAGGEEEEQVNWVELSPLDGFGGGNGQRATGQQDGQGTDGWQAGRQGERLQLPWKLLQRALQCGGQGRDGGGLLARQDQGSGGRAAAGRGGLHQRPALEAAAGLGRKAGRVRLQSCRKQEGGGSKPSNALQVGQGGAALAPPLRAHIVDWQSIKTL